MAARGLVPTPQAAKRLVDIYRLVRIGGRGMRWRSSAAWLTMPTMRPARRHDP